MARNFRPLVGTLTREESVDLLKLLVAELPDDDLSEALRESVPDNVKDELGEAWCPADE